MFFLPPLHRLLTWVAILTFIPFALSTVSPTLEGDAIVDPPAIDDPMPAPELSPEAQRAIAHLAAKQGKPIENYAVGYEAPRVFPLLDRRFVAVTLVDIEATRSIRVLLDEESDEIIDDLAGDVEALEAEEAALHAAKYGKFQVSLYDRLETADEDELLPIAVWAAGRLETPEELYEILALDFPEAAEAMAKGGLPFDVEDEALAQQIQAAYRELLRTRTEALVAGIIAHLQALGADVQTFGGMPSVTVSLTKAEIVELAEREDVGYLFLIEAEMGPSASAVIATDQIVSDLQE